MHKYIIKFYDFYLILSCKNNNKLSFKNERGKFLPLLRQSFWLNFTSILFVHVAFAVAISVAVAVAVATCNWQHTCKRARRHRQAPNNLSFFAIRVGVGGDDQCFELWWGFMLDTVAMWQIVPDSRDSRWMNGWMDGQAFTALPRSAGASFMATISPFDGGKRAPETVGSTQSHPAPPWTAQHPPMIY